MSDHDLPEQVLAAARQDLTGFRPTRTPPFALLQARKRSRDRRRTAGAVAASALAVAGIAALPSLTASPERRTSQLAAEAVADGENPQALTIEGVDATRVGSVPITGAYTDPQDPAALYVYAGQVKPLGFCGIYAVVRVAEQDARTVVLDADRYEPAQQAPDDLACTLELPAAKQHRLDLGVPLDGRRLVDSDGNELEVLDTGDLLVPTALPDGYRLPGKLTVGYGGPGLTGSDVTLHTFAGPDAKTQIEVYQGTPATLPGEMPKPPSVIVVDRPSVRGHEGVVTETARLQDLTCLRWEETDDLAVSVCSRGNPAPLGAAELVAVAESMKPTRDTVPSSTASGSSAGSDGNRWWLTTAPQPRDRTLDLTVHEQACASGQSADGRIRYDVSYDDDSIVVTITTVSPAGEFQTCQGNPDTPLLLPLSEPVGDRAILDGRTTPASEARTSDPDGFGRPPTPVPTGHD